MEEHISTEVFAAKFTKLAGAEEVEQGVSTLASAPNPLPWRQNGTGDTNTDHPRVFHDTIAWSPTDERRTQGQPHWARGPAPFTVNSRPGAAQCSIPMILNTNWACMLCAKAGDSQRGGTLNRGIDVPSAHPTPSGPQAVSLPCAITRFDTSLSLHNREPPRRKRTQKI